MKVLMHFKREDLEKHGPVPEGVTFCQDPACQKCHGEPSWTFFVPLNKVVDNGSGS